MLKSTLYQIFAIPTNGEKTNRFFEQPTRQGMHICSHGMYDALSKSP